MLFRSALGLEEFVHQTHEVPVDGAAKGDGGNASLGKLLGVGDKLVIGLGLAGDPGILEKGLVVIERLALESVRNAVSTGRIVLGEAERDDATRRADLCSSVPRCSTLIVTPGLASSNCLTIDWNARFAESLAKFSVQNLISWACAIEAPPQTPTATMA